MPQQPLNEQELRAAMRDRRYWQPGNPERERHAGWVTEGWRALAQAGPAGGGGTVQVRAYERRGPDGQIVQVQAHDRGAPQRAWEAQPNPQWRAEIAREETNQAGGDFGYGRRGQAGTSALGRYQMNDRGLAGAGWRNEARQWTARARAAGVNDDAAFLANPAAQEAAFNDYLRSNEEQLRLNGSWSRIGTTVQGLRGGTVPITAAGLAAAAHREGPRAVAEYLAHRRQGLPIPPSARGRGPLSKFNQVEARLRGFANTPYASVSR